jgi:hypothetical protein
MNIYESKISDEDWINYQFYITLPLSFRKTHIGAVGVKQEWPILPEVKRLMEWIPAHEWDYDVPAHPQTCSHFGCPRILSIREALFGDYCIDHKPKESMATICYDFVSA